MTDIQTIRHYRNLMQRSHYGSADFFRFMALAAEATRRWRKTHNLVGVWT